MLALPELQRAFWRAVTGGDVDPALLRAVVPSDALGAGARLDVYAGMYVARIVEVLQEDFPKLAAMLGAEGFAALGRAYVAHHPSTEPSIGWIGASLPDFVAGRPGLPPWAADLARLEWTRRCVFEASDAEPIGLAALRAVPPEDWAGLRFGLVPACTTVVLDWPVQQLWASEAETLPALEPARTALRVWREAYRVYHAPMDRAEETALERLAAGAPFADLCEALEGPETAAALLLRWVEDGILVRAGDPDDAPPS